MSARIPDAFIQTVLAKTDIVSLIQESVSLKRVGAHFVASCPFHQEKTPSFHVNAAKQCYHCFGCGVHGDAIQFLMSYRSLTFVDAISHLSERVGMTVPFSSEASSQKAVQQAMYALLQRVADFYQSFWKTAVARTALRYLRARGISEPLITQYGLGFAPPGWDHLFTHFSSEKEKALLMQIGLVVSHPKGHRYDRFRNRILFPIRDKQGRVMGFGGRVLDDSVPKYLNASESPVFHKGHALYGLYEASLHRRTQKLLVVEGYFDVLLVRQAGLVALATLGTAVTKHHMALLFQQGEEVVFCFDGDTAGQAAAWKALQLVLPFLTETRQVSFVFLPEGTDPDLFIRQEGSSAFQKRVEQAVPLSEWLFAKLCQEIPLTSMDNRARLASRARALIACVPEGIFQTMLYEQLAQMIATSAETVRFEKTGKKRLPRTARLSQPVSPAWIACGLLLRDPDPVKALQVKTQLTGLSLSHIAGIEMLQSVLALLLQEPSLPLEALKAALISRGFASKRLIDCEEKVACLPFQGIALELEGAVRRLKSIGQRKMTEQLLEKAKITGLSVQEKEKLKKILRESAESATKGCSPLEEEG